MAEANKKIVTLDLMEDVKVYIDARDTAVDAKSLKSGKYENNTVYLYTSSDKSGDAVVTLTLPKEMFLDQTKTKFVPNFTWSNAAYPGSDDASELNGQAVLVLAVKGEDNSVSYSFLSISEAITIYKGGSTNTATITVTGDTITAAVKVSDKANNLVNSDTNGLFVLPATGSTGAADVSVSASNVISVTLNASEESGNAVTIEDNGIFVPEITAGDATDTITVSITDNKVTAEANVSEEDDNALVVTDDGLGVFASDADDNILEVKEDGGLYVPEVKLEYATKAEIGDMFKVNS